MTAKAKTILLFHGHALRDSFYDASQSVYSKGGKVIRTIIITLISMSFSMILEAQTFKKMERKIINTAIGQIAVFEKESEAMKTPVIFLHGVYLDHNLWQNQIDAISDRRVIAVDMPLHGQSKGGIKDDWSLDDCAAMLIEILDSLNIEKVIAIGHSWGSMTIVRAADKYPNRFKSLGLCNMPFQKTSKKEKRSIKMQHMALVFRTFYIKQAGKALIGKESLSEKPDLIQKVIAPMSKLTNKEIKYTDRAVRINAEDVTDLVSRLTMPILALVGEEDYVGTPPIQNTKTVNGGHVSPLEVPGDVNNMVSELIAISD